MEADRDCTYADAFERSRVKFTNSGREREREMDLNLNMK